MEMNTNPRVIVANTHTNTAYHRPMDCYQAIGSQLTAMLLQLGAARSALDHNPQDVDAMLSEMQVAVRETIRDIRARSNGGHP